MKAKSVAIVLFYLSLAMLSVTVLLIEWPMLEGAKRTCGYYMFASVVYIPLTYLATLLFLISTIIVPSWKRVGAFVALAPLYPVIVSLFC